MTRSRLAAAARTIRLGNRIAPRNPALPDGRIAGAVFTVSLPRAYTLIEGPRRMTRSRPAAAVFTVSPPRAHTLIESTAE